MNENKSSITILTKKTFEERQKSECFSVKHDVEEKLKIFSEDDILAFEVAVNSPAIVIGVKKVNGIVDFITNSFIEEGVEQKDINSAFSFSEKS